MEAAFASSTMESAAVKSRCLTGDTDRLPGERVGERLGERLWERLDLLEEREPFTLTRGLTTAKSSAAAAVATRGGGGAMLGIKFGADVACSSMRMCPGFLGDALSSSMAASLHGANTTSSDIMSSIPPIWQGAASQSSEDGPIDSLQAQAPTTSIAPKDMESGRRHEGKLWARFSLERHTHVSRNNSCIPSCFPQDVEFHADEPATSQALAHSHDKPCP
jgi:hypothetical protein